LFVVFAVGRERVGTPTSWFRRTVGVVERAYSGPFEVSSPYLTVVINYMYRTEQGLGYPFIILRLAAPNHAGYLRTMGLFTTPGTEPSRTTIVLAGTP